MPPTFIAFNDEIKLTNHRKGDVIQTNRLLFATRAGILRNHQKATHNNKLMNALMADGGGYAKKSLKRGPKFKKTTVSDVCRLCRNNLKEKFGDFSKNSCITAVNVFKPWTARWTSKCSIR